MKIKFILLALSLGVAASAYAGYASSDENVLPTDYALDYKGEGNLECNYAYEASYVSWDEYAICFFGYEAIESVSVQHGPSEPDYSSVYYYPLIYIYGGTSSSDMVQYVFEEYGYYRPDVYTVTFSNIPADVRYIKVRFEKPGWSSFYGSSTIYSVNAKRTDSFSVYDGENKLEDGATVNLTAGEEKVFTVNLYAVKHLPTTDDVTVEVVAVSGNHPLDYIAVNNCTFNDFTVDSSRSGCYNLDTNTKANMKINFLYSGVYKIYVNVKYKGLIIQRRYLTFDVSDN